MQMKYWRILFGLALVGSLVLGVLGDTDPVYIWDFALFFALFGLLGCLFLSYLAKGLVSPMLDRPEDFYAPEDAENDWSTQSPAAEAGMTVEAGDAGDPPGEPAGHDDPNRGEG
jgi:hypothetical protein